MRRPGRLSPEIPSFAYPDEGALLRRLVTIPFESVIVVSDLHLGPGADPSTGTWSATENFVADDAFARLLRHESTRTPGRRLLILLGDTFDFVRIRIAPRVASDFARWEQWLHRLGCSVPVEGLGDTVDKWERTYGLRTFDYKSIWKLGIMLEGHAGFLRALRAWIGGEGYVVVAKGNHDLELHWPLVRRAIRGALVDASLSLEAVTDRLAFAEGSFTLGNLYLEHGHQHEAMTRVEGSAVLRRDPRKRRGESAEIRYPLGSFVNRYFINRIERLDPFIDNRKPVQAALLALLRRRPLAVLRVYWEGWGFLKKAVSGEGTRNLTVAALILAMLFVPIAALLLVLAWIVFPGFRQAALDALPFLRPGWVRVGGSLGGLLFPALLPYLLGAFREVLRELRILRHRDHLAEAAPQRLATAFPGETHTRIYAVMGHTHRQTVVQLRPGPRPEYYVNTGTWIPLWPADRLDLAGRVIYSVTRFTREGSGAWVHEALEWNDDAGELREASILAAPEGAEPPRS